MTKRIAMGISQPAGRSRTFSDHGRNACNGRRQLRDPHVEDWWSITTDRNDLVMMNGEERCCHCNGNREDVPCWRILVWIGKVATPSHRQIVSYVYIWEREEAFSN